MIDEHQAAPSFGGFGALGCFAGFGAHAARLAPGAWPASRRLRLPGRHSAGTRPAAPGSAVPGFRAAGRCRAPRTSARSAGLRQQVEQLRRRGRHRRLREDRELAHDLGRDVEDRALALDRQRLVERLLRREVAVRFADDGPHRVEPGLDRLPVHGRARRRHRAHRPWRQDRRVGVGERARRRHLAVEALGDHRQRALREIAEAVGEIGVDAVDDRLVIVVAVLAERDLAQEEIAHLIDAVVSSASANGSTTLPTDFDIFSPLLSRKPWPNTRLGSGRPADIRKAGQ